MQTMCCNLSKGQALPVAFKVSANHPKCFKPYLTPMLPFSSHGFHVNPSQNPNFSSSSHGSSCNTHNTFRLSKAPKDSLNPLGSMGDTQLRKVRRFSDFYRSTVAGGNGVGCLRRNLPWLDDSMIGESVGPVKVGNVKAGRSSWEESAKKFIQRNGASSAEDETGRDRAMDVVEHRGKKNVKRDETVDEDAEDDVEIEEVDDPRWYKIKSKLNGVASAKPAFRKPESRTWSRQENWGRKTFREVTESSVPKMVGEGVYGVGPVLAALSTGRREFYVLYVQQGLDLSSNNRKKKDKKGFEKVLKLADKVGLSIKEVSKHDLNMIVDSRPHQGLVLDASPLEMVNIKELDPVSADGDRGMLWIALDEVTDPQNLGAIVRSAYFFGAAGVVLCAKNSAPLSGVVSKASAGSLELMEVRSCKNMMQFISSSAENGWRVLGASVSARASPLREVSPGPPTIIVLGSEGTGLRPLVERSCTQLVRIPGNYPVHTTAGRVGDAEDIGLNPPHSGLEFQSFLAVESLNVSVAAGVLLHHLIGNNYSNASDVVDEGSTDL
ncbi:hypothetical protein Dimus_026640 [Dionaea muscipula]